LRHWWQPRLTPAAALLLPAAWLFGAVAGARRALYRHRWMRSWHPGIPVVVVGNLTVGGSGKTPLVIALAQALRARGRHPGVVSRGYGSAAAGVREVATSTLPADAGDEPLLIRRRADCPVFVGRDRPAACRALRAAYPAVDVIIADDGLQHYALARDFALAVFDERGAGNGRLLPAGPLREPLARARTLDAVVLNGAAATGPAPPPPAWRMLLVPQPLYSLADPARRLAPQDFVRLHGPRVAGVAGIGSPRRFFDSLAALGLAVDEHPFPDHHPYRRADLLAIIAGVIVMTEKDAIKCADFGDPRIWVLPVAAEVESALIDAIQEKLRGPQTA
jgi:tetraacyldisaccharide 4'-kinase